ncbi:discoidin domain-containing protein [Candidatus Methylospira mobilis]|uniref:discoidin domain-containing protein n=1 Tax=Candidatus Methylospira mobilis TaxID=1808979 RepID=UPI0028EF7B63|nr:discoidin domain-containing protein [Candidatus Methylospira mobilis]WNV06139.1 discoidin domain-containing protein [Candidatus Methylospira mobilis]
MTIPAKRLWTVTASSGDPSFAIDDIYATTWISDPLKKIWLQIDLGEITTLGGIEVYWGRQAANVYRFVISLDGNVWTPICRTGHGEGGQNVFAFPPSEARFLRWSCEDPESERRLEIVEINVYSPAEALSVLEEGRIAALGHAPVKLPCGESITVDFGYQRSPLGVKIQWGETHGTVFSVHLSDDGEQFREVGRILTSNGGYDDFYWRTTTSRYLRFTLHESSAPEGAVVNELKVRILNKDRMPIGRLERAAQAGRGELYPQALLNRQVYWTALGEVGHSNEALFDEYGNIEPRIGFGQLTPLLRIEGSLHGAPGSPTLNQSLAEGALPIPSVAWSAQGIEIGVTALAEGGQAMVEYRISNRSGQRRIGALVLAVRPVQINPYWQKGGHAVINAIAVDDRWLEVNDRPYAAFSSVPDAVTIVEFDDDDVVKPIADGAQQTVRTLQSGSGLLSAACEFEFSLEPGDSIAFVAALPLRDGITPSADELFTDIHQRAVRFWRDKIGARKIMLGNLEISDTLEAQTGLILVNATASAFKPGPRNYDRIWIRDGSSQALALLYAGLIDEAKAYVVWYAERIYENGLVPPILNPDGSVNRGYGSDIEFDAQGQFVAIAADVYRFSRDREFLNRIFEPVTRATRFIEELCARTDALYGPDSRFHGLLAPSISHEGYNKPVYSYWDDFFALRAWRDCEYLAAEIGNEAVAAHAQVKGRELAANLARSIRLTADLLGRGLVPASADHEDVDQTSTSVAFEPCRVDDVLPQALLTATYDVYIAHLDAIGAPGFSGGFTPYEIRNLNALVALGRFDDAYRLLTDSLAWRRPAGWRHWAEVVWGEKRAADYIGDMPHTWIGAEFATAVRRMLVRENGATLELFRAVPEAWWATGEIILRDLPTTFGALNLKASRDSQQINIDLALSGPAPDEITFRYPGVKTAHADGQPCAIDGDVVTAANFGRLVIEL